MYCTGNFESLVDFNPGQGVFNLTHAGNGDLFILKLNASGNFVWAKSIGGIYNDRAFSITLDKLGDVYTTGVFNNTVDFDPGAGVFNLSSVGIAGNSIFISKLDGSGNFKWARNFVGKFLVFRTSGKSLMVDDAYDLYIAGAFADTANFAPNAGNYYLSTNINKNDAYVAKFGQTTFPLNLLTFTAKRATTTNLLNWTTAQEVNTDRFEIERSSNCREFNKIGVVKANSMNGQYSYADNSPLTTAHSLYYRLKMLDKDGQFTYSPIRQININHSSLTIVIFPNPAKDNLQLQLESEKQKTINLQVVSQDGKVLLSKQVIVLQGTSLQNINISKLVSGHYFLKAIGETTVLKFEKL